MPQQTNKCIGLKFLLVASYIYIPFMILPIFNSMKAIPNNILQASNDLGASTFTTFRKVIVPLTREGIVPGNQPSNHKQ
jgi:spermidine/putrescine transport system permease protein